MVSLEFRLTEGEIEDLAKDTMTAFIGLASSRKAEIKVSKLTGDQRKRLPEAKAKLILGWMKYQVVCAASRQGLSAGQLMRMRWVITLKDDDSLKARLVVQGFTDPELGNIATSSPTCSRRARQIFFAASAALQFRVVKGDVKCAFLQGDTGGREILCEPVNELREALALEHYECDQLTKSVYALGEAPRQW